MDELTHHKREISRHIRTYNLPVKRLGRETGISPNSISGILHDPDGYPARRSTILHLRLHLGLGEPIREAGQHL